MFRDLLGQIEAHARGMWRYRWPAAMVAWLMCLAGWVGVYLMPNVYEANARIYVDTENAIRPLLQGIAASSNVLNEVNVVTREMLSRPNLAEVARDTDLDLRAETDKEFEALLESLQKRITVIGSIDNIYSIAFQDPDRSKAIAVVDSLVNTFVEKSLGADRTESSQAQDFLQEQIKIYEERLTESENRLARFKQENVAVMPGQQGDYFSRLQASRENLEATQGKLRLAQERRTELLRQLEGEEPVFGITTTNPGAESGGSGFNSAKIRELELQLEELRLQYTDKHPRIGQILDTLELLKEQQEEERVAAAAAARASPSSANPLDLNPVYQNMRIQLTNTEVEIASLRAEANQQQEQVASIRRLVDTVPQVEAELNRLNRDYDVVKEKHQQLLQQLESASIGENVEASIDKVQFRVIDPPFAGLQPAGPKRHLFIVLVLLLALGAGGALTFLMNLIHPVFFSSRAVTAATGIPVLGAVSLKLSDEERRQKRNSRFRFVAAMALLLGSFLIVSVFANQWSPLLRNLGNMVS